MTAEEAKAKALSQFPDCEYAEVYNGMNAWLELTHVVKLWRNEECYLAGDPCRHEVEGMIQT